MNRQISASSNKSNSHDFFELTGPPNWEEVYWIFKNSRQNIFVTNPSDKCTLLHYACLQKNRIDVTKKLKWILDYIEAHPVEDRVKVQFVNQKDSQGNTALQLVSKKRNQTAAELLIKNGADISLLKYSPDTNAMRELYLPIFQKMFDDSITVSENEDDANNFLLRSIRCDFGTVWGKHNIPTKDCVHSLPQTQQLATMLQWKVVSKSTILDHPIVQLFIHFKQIRFAKLLYVFLIVQIFWYLLSCAFIFCNSQIFDSTQSNKLERALNYTEFCTPFKIFEEDNVEIRIGKFFAFMIFVTVISILKEILRFALSSNKRKYWKQFGNLGRLGVVVAFIAVWIMASTKESRQVAVRLRDAENLESNGEYIFSGILPSIYIFGMFSSLLLVQHQLSKTRLLGVYNEMFTRAFQSMLKFGAAFLPFLFAFLITFHVLLPMRPEFRPQWGLGFAKIFTMMSGEVDYDGVNHGDDRDLIAYKNVLKGFTLVFVVTVVVLLQNLLVGLTVSDVQKMENKAKIKTAACLIEDIFLWERFLLWLSHSLRNVEKCADVRKWLIETMMVTETDLMRTTRSGKLKAKRLNEFSIQIREKVKEWEQERMMLDSTSQSDA